MNNPSGKATIGQLRCNEIFCLQPFANTEGTGRAAWRFLLRSFARGDEFAAREEVAETRKCIG